MNTKNLFIAIGILAVAGVLVGIVAVKGATTDSVTATVEIGSVSVTVTPESFDYGTIPFSTTKESYDTTDLSSTNIDAQVGGVLTDLDIKGTSTVAWTLAGSIGENQYVHSFGTTTDDGTRPSSYTALTDTYTTLYADVASGTTKYFGLKIAVPSGGETSQQSAAVDVMASWGE